MADDGLYPNELGEDEKLTVEQKRALASRHAELNALLKEKRQVEEELDALGQRMNALRKRATQLDYQFHKRALETEPTIIGRTAGGKRQPKEPDVAAKIAARLKEKPELLESAELQELLKSFI